MPDFHKGNPWKVGEELGTDAFVTWFKTTIDMGEFLATANGAFSWFASIDCNSFCNLEGPRRIDF
jgi:hypothetical protein